MSHSSPLILPAVPYLPKIITPIIYEKLFSYLFCQNINASCPVLLLFIFMIDIGDTQIYHGCLPFQYNLALQTSRVILNLLGPEPN